MVSIILKNIRKMINDRGESRQRRYSLRVGGEGPQTLEQKGSSLRLAVVELAFKHAVNERNGSFAEEQAFRGTAGGYSATIAHIDAWETALFVQLPIAKDVEGP